MVINQDPMNASGYDELLLNIFFFFQLTTKRESKRCNNRI